MTRDSARIREYGEQHGINRLTTPEWLGKQQDAWEMAALANHLCGTKGIYRGPAGVTTVYFIFGEVQ